MDLSDINPRVGGTPKNPPADAPPKPPTSTVRGRLVLPSGRSYEVVAPTRQDTSDAKIVGLQQDQKAKKPTKNTDPNLWRRKLDAKKAEAEES
jgi:hypothetical protein